MISKRKSPIGRLMHAVGIIALLSTSTSGVAAYSHWQHFPQRPAAPKGAPNVLLIMTDDVGFGAASSFGGLIATPTFDAVGQEGIRFNRFHTTSMCSPTRAALLTGRNHHAVNNGAIANLARDIEGYTSALPDSAATIADILRANGYVTAFLGKNHNTPEWESGPMGPFDRWPTGMGFDYFYGFNAAWADQFAPELVENTTQIEPPADALYTLDRDLSDHAIEWLQRRSNSAEDAPFFLYVAPGSPHTPHQAPAEWIARYAGHFDMGWDKAREQIFARQKQLGIIPADAVLTPRPKELPAWTSLSRDERAVASRMMEIYAAQLSYSDQQIGRIIAELRRTNELDNTLIIFLEGDNGADMASFSGSSNEFGAFFGEEPQLKDLIGHIGVLGSSHAFGGYPAAWAWATNTPFQWGKSVAGYLGAIRSGAAMSWPRGMDRRGVIEPTFAHVIDIAPTIYEAAGITPPASFAGTFQQPLDGASLFETFRRGQSSATSDHRTLYFEMLGNLGFYADGWLATTKIMRPPWDRTSARTPLPSEIAHYTWELYDLERDYSQSRDLARREPGRLAAMIAGFTRAAKQNHILPVENDVMVLLAPGTRPEAIQAGVEHVYSRSGTRYVAADLPTLGGQWRITAKLNVAHGGASGPIFTQGSRFSGWGLMLRAGVPMFVSRPSFDPAKATDLSARNALSAGNHTIVVEIMADPSKGPFAGTARFTIDGEVAGEGNVADRRTLAGPAYIGRFGPTPLIEDAGIPSSCKCQVDEVRLLPLASGRGRR